MQIRLADGQRSESGLALAAQEQSAGGTPSGPVRGCRAAPRTAPEPGAPALRARLLSQRPNCARALARPVS